MTVKVALIVDDEVFARLMAIQVLLEDDYCILEAGDATEALEVLEHNDDITLLITDVNMPGPMDGVDLAELVHWQRPQMQIILTSGFGPPLADDIPTAARFMPKPFSAASLRSIIRNIDAGSALTS
jgi:DNA-binding NtrC family response regulator